MHTKKKKKTEWTTHKHACSSKFPDLVLTEITTTFFKVPSQDCVADSVRFLNQDISFNTVGASLMTCALMVSCLRLSACFIYDKRA